MTETARLTIQSQPYTFSMEVKPSLIGEGIINLVSSEARINCNVPLAAFPFLTLYETVYVTLSIFRVAVENVSDIQPPGLVLGKGEVN